MENDLSVRISGVFLFMFACGAACLAQAPSDGQSSEELRTQAIAALNEGETENAIQFANAIVKKDGDEPGSMLWAADVYLRCGKADEAVTWYDRYLKSTPEALPSLWQRGIALYFVGDYKRGAAQFEEHRKVNPNDVENAAWHFLCIAKLDSMKTARQLVLPAPDDPRIPMREVLAMLSSGDTEMVRRRMDSVPENTEGRKQAEFYGYFYLGLYADAAGDRNEALRSLSRSATHAPHHYMGDIARVYAQFLKQQLASDR